MDRDLANVRAAGRHRVLARAVIYVKRPSADVPERLQPTLAVDELDVLCLWALEQVFYPAAESAPTFIHRPQPSVLWGELVVEKKDVLIRERDLHQHAIMAQSPHFVWLR